WCRFGARCNFGERCSFGQGCVFGAWCRFGERCSFGAWCRFGEECGFGERCVLEGKTAITRKPIFSLGYAGSEGRTTYALHVECGPLIRCGCFLGTLPEFRAKVRETHGEDSKHAMVYLGWANLVAVQFDRLDLVEAWK
ncbi:MAG: zinc finger CCCH domain-containing protein, partial [Sterolibacterium sp.]